MIRRREALWLALPLGCALLVIHAGLSAHDLLFQRDLASYFWPAHLWFRHTVLAGHAPWWDPYLSHGYYAASDPALSIFFPPFALLRVALPEVLGFNLTVVLAYPLAAAGMYLFLRARLSPRASALGALLYSSCGSFTSLATMLFFAWTVALIPWILWAIDRAVARRTVGAVGLAALLYGALALVGEPVTVVATALTSVAWAASRARGERIFAVVATGVAGVIGILLASIQILPLLDATSTSTRSTGVDWGFWSLHPLSLLEVVVSSVFGRFMDPLGEASPWLRALNDRREPYLLSLYLGPAPLILAAASLGSRRHRGLVRFFAVLALIALVLALGRHTPIYGFVRETVPGFALFRYPAKYFNLFALSIAVLAATTLDDLPTRPAPALLAAALGFAAALTLAVVAFAAGPAAFTSTAAALSLDPEAAATLAAALARGAPMPIATALLTATILLASWHRPSATGFLATLVLAAIALDVTLTNASLIRALPAEPFLAPSWRHALEGRPPGRIYINRRALAGDGPLIHLRPSDVLAILSARENTEFTLFPHGWAVPESVSEDVTLLRPASDAMLHEMFRAHEHPDRLRFLERSGVRYFLTPWQPSPDAAVLAELPGFDGWALRELPRGGARVHVVPRARVLEGIGPQLEALFDAGFAFEGEVLLERDAPAHGAAGKGVGPAAATITRETPTAIDVRAVVPEGGGFLLLMDSYHPGWRAWVDGGEVEVVRGDGKFRVVALAEGTHSVEMRFAPRSLQIGAATSGVTALLLAIALVFFRRRRIS